MGGASFPLFLLARELRMGTSEAAHLPMTDTILLCLLAVAMLGLMIWVDGAGLSTIATRFACLAEQADSDGQVELGPRAIGSQNLGGCAADCQGEAAAIAQRQPTSAGQGPHCPGQFGIGFGHRLDRDAGGGEQFTDPADIEIGVYQLANDFREVRCAQ